ncbi:MAG: hypothetical protein GY772_28405 [bacterium]|jgi:hypothetical protein|nr:hypothetical protein [bacterium]
MLNPHGELVRETVAILTRMPSFISSAWILPARQAFSVAIRMMRAFVSSEIGGRPGPGVEIDRQ